MFARRRQTNSGSDRDTSPSPRQSSIYQPQYSSISQSLPTAPPFVNSDMSGRDRTVEFMSAVKSMKSRQANGAISKHSNTPLKQQSQFTLAARQIGKDISNTFTKLEKLTILAKKKSLFEDNSTEIQELTYIIKEDIGSLNKQIAQLQQLVKSQRTQNGRHVQTHSNSVVVALQSKLAGMSNDFKSVLEVRTENLKLQKSRREEFSQSPVASSLPPSAMSGPGQSGSVLLQDEASHRGGDVAINMDPADRQRYQQQLQLIDEQDTYIQSRSDTMQNIESTIVELGGIFTQLAHMVKEQEEMVQRIDTNVEDTQLNVEGAHSELLKYFQSVSSNRWLMIKVFGVLIVFFIIFIVLL